MAATTTVTSTCPAVLLSIKNTPSDQLRTPTCYAHPLAPQINITLKTWKQSSKADRDGAVPSIEEIRERVIAVFQSIHLPAGKKPGWRMGCLINRELPRLYPRLRVRRVEEAQAYQILLEEKRPVYVGISLRQWEGDFIRQYFMIKSHQKKILTQFVLEARSKACKLKQSEEALHGRFLHAVLLTGYDPSSGVCTFLNSWGPRWGDNGHFRVQNMAVLGSAPEARLTFDDVYVPPDTGSRATSMKASSPVDSTIEKLRVMTIADTPSP